VAAGGLDAADPYEPPLPPDELPEELHAARTTALAAAAGSTSSNEGRRLIAFNLQSDMAIVPPALV
jgi:hypothetical protein